MSAKETATVEIQAKANGLRAQLRDIAAQFGKFADGVGSQMKRGWKAALGPGKEKKPGEGFLRDAGKTAVGNLMSGGISKAASYIEDTAKGALDFEDKLTRLQIQANETPQAMRAFANSVREASDATGIGKDKILEGASAFVTLTGDMKTARESATTFAKVGQATGTSVDDIAKASAAASQNLGITSDQFEQMFDVMTGQGKAGAIELKDMAAELSTIAPQWAQFAGGKGLRGARELGAAMQIIKKGFGGDASETTTGLQDMMTAVLKKGDRFAKLGVGSFFEMKNGKRDLKSVYDIVDQIASKKLGKDSLVKAFGSVEAYRAFLQLRDNRQELEKMSDASQFAGTIQRDFSTYMESSGGKMSQAFEKMKNAVAAAFTPERITAFANAMESLADKVGPVADFLGKAADVLGGISGVGQSVRGMFGDDANPYGDFMGQQVLKLKAQGGDQNAAAQLANAGSYSSTAANILAGEQNDRTSKESIRRAALAQSSSNLGEVSAGSRYLANVYGSGDEVNAAVEKVLREEWDKTAAAILKGTGIGGGDKASMADLVGYLRQIATNTGAGTEVKIDGNPVAKSVKNAPSNRTAVKR